jgi:hypothetical protein
MSVTAPLWLIVAEPLVTTPPRGAAWTPSGDKVKIKTIRATQARFIVSFTRLEKWMERDIKTPYKKRVVLWLAVSII